MVDDSSNFSSCVIQVLFFDVIITHFKEVLSRFFKSSFGASGEVNILGITVFSKYVMS